MSETPSEAVPRTIGECSFGRCTLVLADYVHAIRHEPRTLAVLRWATLVGTLGTALGVALLATTHLWSGLAALAVGLAAFAAHEAPEHAAARWYARTPARARELRFTLSREALIVTSEVSSRAYPWPSLLGQHQAPQSFLVWVDARSFVILPKRAFEPAELPRVSGRLERELGGAPPLSPLWARLLVSAALIAGLLWLWNWLDPR